jgi:hypothetical protein
MGLVYDLNINRDCKDCIFGEFDLLEQNYWCNLRQAFRSPDDRERCPDIKTTQD